MPFDDLDPWLRARVPNTMRTRFDSASINKVFTSLAALQLVGEGMLSLDGPITGVGRPGWHDGVA